ncbi:hypothetical protein JAAARDRAFT_192481 [Jaapia argillacea MUCL 33604]|uniref:Uncharacterized protein n=1 Tax=Jaapia argillacea MUCL 33604 TaxID=933084 RepID=A0A067PVQ3_9AGAM|nr:hypothetical protein JAAARDRAFT_192481 [Jaapia argillacea MUCL 33604]
MEEGLRAISDRQEVTQATTASTVDRRPHQHPVLFPSTLSESLDAHIFRTPTKMKFVTIISYKPGLEPEPSPTKPSLGPEAQAQDL